MRKLEEIVDHPGLRAGVARDRPERLGGLAAGRQLLAQVGGPGGDRLCGRLHVGKHRRDEAVPRAARLLGGGAELPLAFEGAGKRLLGALPFVDVDAGTHVAQEKTVAGTHRCGAVQHPAVLAVVPAHAVLHFERLACVEGTHAAVEPAREVFGMHGAGPAVALCLVGAQAGEFEPRAAHVIAGHVRLRAPKHEGDGVV